MSDDIKRRLQQAARLQTLIAVSRARRRNPQSMTTSTNMTQFDDTIEPNENARALTADLLARLALDAAGRPFNEDDPSTWDAADETEPEIVRLGAVRFRVIDADPRALTLAAGALEADGPPRLCLLVQFADDEDAPQPAMGQYLNVATEEPGVSLLFRVAVAHADLHDPAAPDLGPEAVRTEGLEAIADYPGRALLVQVFSDEEDGYEH